MKKLMLLAAGALFIGGAVSYAQDTAGSYRIRQGIDQPKNKSMNDPSDHTMKNEQNMKGDQGMKGWTKVNPADLPASLRQTLSSSQYSGWEKSSVYVNQSGDRYSVRLGNPSSPRTYYFDKSGKPLEGIPTTPNTAK